MILVLESQILNAKGALVSARVVGSQGVPIGAQGDMPLRNQLHVVAHGELTAAVGVVPPQALLPQKRPIQRRFHLVQSEVPGRGPYLTPQYNPGACHGAFHKDAVLLDIIRW